MTQTYAFYTLDVFTGDIFGGNPLAVFPDAAGLSCRQMQAIAREFNLSETVFVLPPTQADCHFRLRIFTPAAEIPFAGHPTVGAAYLLAHLGLVTPEQKILNLQEDIGKVPVTILRDDLSSSQRVQATSLSASQMPQFGSVPEFLDPAALLNLEGGDLNRTLPPEVISCGLPFLYIPLETVSALERAHLNLVLWQQVLKQTEAAHLYLFVILENATIHARMFAPALGIVEDPATGSAATALAGYLDKYCPVHKPSQTWEIQQGIQMGRPSKIQLTMQKKADQLQGIQVGGESVLVSQGTMFVPAVSKS